MSFGRCLATAAGGRNIFDPKASEQHFDRKAILVLAFLIIAFVVHAFLFNYTTDDAFITFRYVRNMIDGHGLVYNTGERVEGYTNFLWAMLVAGPTFLGADIVWTARILGLISGAGVLVLVFLVARYLVPKDFSRNTEMWLALMPVALLAGNGAFAMWAVGGLETVFFTCLLLLVTYFYLRFDGWLAALGCGLLLALLTMTRPDGIVFLAATLVHIGVASIILRNDDARRRLMRNAACILPAFLVLYLPYFAWRYFYYDSLLPNTFYAKVGTETARTLPGLAMRGIRYSWLFLADYGIVPAMAAIFSFNVLMRRPRGTGSFNRKAVLGSSYLLIQIVACIAFVIYVGGDQLVMHRFFVPILPGIYLLIMRGLCEVFPREADGAVFRISKNRRLVIVAACVCGVILTCVPSFLGREQHRVFAVEKPADADRQIVGRWLKNTLGGGTKVALVPAGIIPFYSGLETIDLVGLNDKHIARTKVSGLGKGEAGHEKYNSGYVLQRRPDIMFLGACRIWPRKLKKRALLDYYWLYGELVPGNREMLRLDEFRKNYAPCAARVDWGYIHFLKRNDFEMPLAEPLAIDSGATGLIMPRA